MIPTSQASFAMGLSRWPLPRRLLSPHRGDDNWLVSLAPLGQLVSLPIGAFLTNQLSALIEPIGEVTLER